ncbi:MAG TPA: hypothetical protein VMZ51_05555 [Acidimicrobiales bacterium]|nr:hypothetical protein [Acidimicrobiales bacterium]
MAEPGAVPRRSIACVTALLIVGAAAVTARAALGQALSPANVTVEDFPAVNLDGTAKTTSAAMADFSVTDSAGAGWNVTVSATRFAEVDGAGQYVSGGKALPVGSLAMLAPAFAPSSGLVVVAAGPYLIDGATVKIVSAAPGSSGTFNFSQGGPLTLSLPASAYARAYRSDVTVAVASGP